MESFFCAARCVAPVHSQTSPSSLKLSTNITIYGWGATIRAVASQKQPTPRCAPLFCSATGHEGYLCITRNKIIGTQMLHPVSRVIYHHGTVWMIGHSSMQFSNLPRAIACIKLVGRHAQAAKNDPRAPMLSSCLEFAIGMLQKCCPKPFFGGCNLFVKCLINTPLPHLCLQFPQCAIYHGPRHKIPILQHGAHRIAIHGGTWQVWTTSEVGNPNTQRKLFHRAI